MEGDANQARRTAGRAVLLAATGAATALVLGIELLSRLRAVAWLPMAATAAVAAAVAVAVVRAEAPARTRPRARPGAAGLAVAAIGLVTLATALIAAPNTWDSMTYHLPRVAHWAAEGSVAHYPTSIDRQLWQPPLGEYLILVGWVLLGGRDALANLPAWLAAAGCVLVAVEIARLLGLPARRRGLAALAVATLPPLVLEATSTQTDLPAAFWIGVTAFLALEAWAAPAAGWRRFAWLGAALGLAVGTKGTALPLALPWVAVALAPALRARRLGTAAAGAATVAAAVVALAGPHWMRNLLVFNGPLGPSSVQTLLRPAALDPPTLAGNLLANASVHLGTPWPAANAVLGDAVRAAHAGLGRDPAALYPFFGGFRVDPWSTHENVAGAPLHLGLGVVGLALALGGWRRRTALERAYLAGLVGAVLLLAATVRWQPFNARLHLPVAVVGAPGIALVLGRAGPAATAVLGGALVLASLPAVVGNATRPLWTAGGALAMPGVESVLVAPRRAQYFAGRREALPVFERLAAAVAGLGCTELRLRTGYDGFEYPLGPLLGVDRLRHVFVENASAELGEAPLGPGACVLVVDERPGWRPPAGPPALAQAWAEARAAVWVAR